MREPPDWYDLIWGLRQALQEIRDICRVDKGRYSTVDAVDESAGLALQRFPEPPVESQEAYLARMKAASDAYRAVLIHLDSDYTPYGKEERWADPAKAYRDCSCGCRWYRPMEDEPLDWGVCVNSRSPRAGLLTFEHQGCFEFEREKEEELRDQ